MERNGGGGVRDEGTEGKKERYERGGEGDGCGCDRGVTG